MEFARKGGSAGMPLPGTSYKKVYLALRESCQGMASAVPPCEQHIRFAPKRRNYQEKARRLRLRLIGAFVETTKNGRAEAAALTRTLYRSATHDHLILRLEACPPPF